MPPNDYQYSFRGLTFGNGTPFIVERVEGLLSMAEVKSNDFEREAGDGSVPGIDYFGTRIIRFSIFSTGNSTAEIEANLSLIQSAFTSRQAGIDVLEFKRPGSAVRTVYCRCRKRDIPSEYSVPHGKAMVSVEFVANDPLVYVGSDQTQVINGTGVVNNTSQFVVCPILRITNDSFDLKITNVTDGNKSIVWAIDNIDTYEIVTKSKSIFSISNSARLPRGFVLDPSTDWFVLLPGNNTITVTDGSGSPPPLTVIWRYFIT